MSKKSADARRRENALRHEINEAERARRVRRLPRILPRVADVQTWLAAQSRAVRIVLAGLVAAILTGALALIVFSVMFRIPPDRLTFGPINPGNVLAVTLTALIVAGLAFYWVGWRVLVGFDFGAEPLTPGRAAAVWLYVGLLVLLGTLIAAFLGLFEAISPV